MDLGTLLAWGLVYLAIGALLAAADRRFGVGVRGWLVDLASPEPQGTREGFLHGRKRRVHLAWAFGVGLASAVLLLALGAGDPLGVIVGSGCGVVGSFLGIQVAPLLAGGARTLGSAMDKVDELQEKAPELLEGAVEAGRKVADRVASAVKPDPDAPRPPSAEEERQRKIARMDEILGRGRGES